MPKESWEGRILFSSSFSYGFDGGLRDDCFEPFFLSDFFEVEDLFRDFLFGDLFDDFLDEDLDFLRGVPITSCWSLYSSFSGSMVIVAIGRLMLF